MITFTTKLTEETKEDVWRHWLEWLDPDNDSGTIACGGDYSFDVPFWEERGIRHNKAELLDFVETQLDGGLNSQVFEGWGLGKDSTGETWLSEVFIAYDSDLADRDKVRYDLWDKQVEFYKQLVALADDAGYVVKRQPAEETKDRLLTPAVSFDQDCDSTLNERLVDHDWDTPGDPNWDMHKARHLKLPFDFFIGAKEVE